MLHTLVENSQEFTEKSYAGDKSAVSPKIIKKDILPRGMKEFEPAMRKTTQFYTK
jgi:hypothetical protein